MNAQTQTQAAEFNVDALLDGTLDDLKDLPEFKPYPAGTHRVNLSLQLKKIGTHPAVEAKLKAIETIELNSGSDAALEAGAETSVSFMLDNEYGQGGFKKIVAAMVEHFGPKSNREVIAETQNVEVLVITKQRQNKEKTQSYTDIVELQVV